jgi:hypothetical protein
MKMKTKNINFVKTEAWLLTAAGFENSLVAIPDAFVRGALPDLV